MLAVVGKQGGSALSTILLESFGGGGRVWGLRRTYFTYTMVVTD